MKTMRGFAMLKIGETGWVTKEIPACGPSDAICRPLALAPCTSDVHTVWAGAIGERHNMILGHEAVGEVVEVVFWFLPSHRTGARRRHRTDMPCTAAACCPVGNSLISRTASLPSISM